MKILSKIANLIFGFLILMSFYCVSLLIVQLTKIPIPPAILGLILFAFCLVKGIIKENSICNICNLLINNMSLFILPLIIGVVVYKNLLIKNWIIIISTIFITTTLTIIITGLFVEYGLKFLRLRRIRKK